MGKLIVYGASDDLVEVEGDGWAEEFGYGRGDAFLQVSDGTLLRIAYSPDESGCWRITREVAGSAAFSIVSPPEEGPGKQSAGLGYSDAVTLDGDVRWVAYMRSQDPRSRTMRPVPDAYPTAEAMAWDSIVWPRSGGRGCDVLHDDSRD
jgi:hypothetical protein